MRAITLNNKSGTTLSIMSGPLLWCPVCSSQNVHYQSISQKSVPGILFSLDCGLAEEAC